MVGVLRVKKKIPLVVIKITSFSKMQEIID